MNPNDRRNAEGINVDRMNRLLGELRDRTAALAAQDAEHYLEGPNYHPFQQEIISVIEACVRTLLCVRKADTLEFDFHDGLEISSPNFGFSMSRMVRFDHPSPPDPE